MHERRFRRAAAVLLSASLAFAGRAAAQVSGPEFGVGVGRTLPMGDYRAFEGGQGFTGAWQGMALLAFHVPRLPVKFRIDASYGTNGANDSLKKDLAAALGAGSTATAKLFGGDLDLTASLSSSRGKRVKPYLLGGVGLYRVTISVRSGNSNDNTSGTRFAWNAGGGLRFRVRRVALFLEARYIDVAAVPGAGFPRTTFLPVTAGIWFGGR